jgi:hypothetical protein
MEVGTVLQEFKKDKGPDGATLEVLHNLPNEFYVRCIFLNDLCPYHCLPALSLPIALP